MGLLENSSDLSSEKELGRGKRKRCCALPSDYESERSGSSNSTGSDGDYLSPRPPTPPQMQKHAGTKTFSLANKNILQCWWATLSVTAIFLQIFFSWHFPCSCSSIPWANFLCFGVLANLQLQFLYAVTPTPVFHNYACKFSSGRPSTIFASAAELHR